MANDYDEIVSNHKQKIQAINSLRTFGNRRQIRKMKLAAMDELGRDILNTSITQYRNLGSKIDKNSYPTYVSQVQMAYKMYDGLTDYGSELFASVADMRVAFIAGEGISFTTKNQKKADFINTFLKYNHLNGSKLIAAVLMGEIEGKVLFTLAPNKSDKPQENSIKARLFSWYLNKYTVNRDDQDYEVIKSITYRPKENSAEQSLPIDKIVYVKLGGCNYRNDETPTKLGKILTQCENASRATYDLRKNTHVFGKIMPYWKTANPGDAKVINDALANKSFEIGNGYAGPADMSLLEPSGGAGNSIEKDLLASLRYICSMTGIPIHWMAWPELMSNRATAENMLEVISAATKKERLIWEEKLTEMFDLVLQLGIDTIGADKAILDDEFTIKLPLISLAALKQMVDIWLPLYQEGDLVSRFTMMNMLPGIDPDKEIEQIEDEKEEKAKNSPFKNMSLQDQNIDTDPNNVDPNGSHNTDPNKGVDDGQVN